MTLPEQPMRQFANAFLHPQDIEGQGAQLDRQGRIPMLTGYDGNLAPAAVSGSAASPAQRRFISDMRALAPALRVAAQKYVHPADAARARGMMVAPDGTRMSTAQDLTDSDRLWLQTLPMDPASVPFKDAVELLAMQARVRKPDDRRLVDAVAQPVRDYHDAQAAEVELRNALAAPAPAMPPSALGALADGIAASHPDLTPAEALARANEIVDEIVAQAHTSRVLRIETAHDRLDRLAADREARAAVQPVQNGA